MWQTARRGEGGREFNLDEK